MFGKRRKITETFDRKEKIPVIRCSICTGEQVAGFKELQSGRFEEIMVIRDAADYEEFLSRYGINRDEVTKIW
jgi:hypothetical protein